MRLVELLRNFATDLIEDTPKGSLNSDQARKRQERIQKQLRRAAEITRTASAKAAAIRADVS